MPPATRSALRDERTALSVWAAVFTVTRIAAVAANKAFLKRRQAAQRRGEPKPFFLWCSCSLRVKPKRQLQVEQISGILPLSKPASAPPLTVRLSLQARISSCRVPTKLIKSEESNS